MASRFGHLQIVKFLVESGADLNILRFVFFLDFKIGFYSYSRSTPLMEATAAGQIDCVRFLLKKGCKVNLQGKSFFFIILNNLLNFSELFCYF